MGGGSTTPDPAYTEEQIRLEKERAEEQKKQNARIEAERVEAKQREGDLEKQRGVDKHQAEIDSNFNKGLAIKTDNDAEREMEETLIEAVEKLKDNNSRNSDRNSRGGTSSSALNRKKRNNIGGF